MVAVEGGPQLRVIEVLADGDDLRSGFRYMIAVWVQRQAQAAPLDNRQQAFDHPQDRRLAIERGLHGELDQLHAFDGLDDPSQHSVVAPLVQN
ncbi:hypothetical protein D3C84_993540 [compost metagenome]